MIALALLAGLAGAGWWWWERPDLDGPLTMTDTAEIVSLAIPAGWTDTTRSDAREIDGVRDSDGPYRVPDLSAGQDGGEGPRSSIHLSVDTQPHEAKPGVLHQIAVADFLESDDPDVGDPIVTSATVAGSPALVTTLRWPASSDGPASISTVTTIATGTYLVTVVGNSNDPSDPDAASLGSLIDQLEITG